MRLIVIILQVAWIGLTECRRNPESEKQLRKSVLQDYDKLSFPPSGNTSIKIFIHGISIHNLQMHEDTHSLEVQSLLSYGWTDLRLRWDLSEHMDLDRLGMEPDQIWKPDLAVYNTVNEDFRLHKSQLPLLVYPDGSVMFEPPVHLHFTCVMDLTYWPHDTHNCSVMIGSWVHNGFMMDMEVTSDTPKFNIESHTMDPSVSINIYEWEVVEAKMARMTHHYSCCNEPYVAMKVSLLLRRSAPAYAWSVKTPALCMCILTVVLFLLPPGAGEKLVFGGLCLILDLLFIAYTSNIVSHAPTHTPLIIQLASQQLVLVVVSVLLAALVLRLAKDPHPYPLPSIFKSPAITLSYFLCLSNYTKLVASTQQEYAFAAKTEEVELGEDCSDDDSIRRVNPRGLYNHQWLLLAAIFDRLALLLYLAICVITLIRFSSVL